MPSDLPRALHPAGGETKATVKSYRCRYCGRGNEVRWVGFVPADFYNEVAAYVRAAAGDEFVLLPAATLKTLVPRFQHEDFAREAFRGGYERGVSSGSLAPRDFSGLDRNWEAWYREAGHADRDEARDVS